MLQFQIARTLSAARWQSGFGRPGNTVLFSHEGELFAANHLHEFQVPQGPVHLRLLIQGTTTEYGQKLFVGLLEHNPKTGACGGRGFGISLDPETGRVEDLHNGGGVVGYAGSVPQDPGRPVSLVLETWLYGRTCIPRLTINRETLALPAVLLEPGFTMAALTGGEISRGSLPRVDHTELSLLPLTTAMIAHG